MPLWIEKYLSILDENINRLLISFPLHLNQLIIQPQKIPKQLKNTFDFVIKVFQLSSDKLVCEKTIQYFLLFLSTLEMKAKQKGKFGIVLLINCIDYVIQNIIDELIEFSEIMNQKLNFYIELFKEYRVEFNSKELFQMIRNPNVISMIQQK